MPCMCGDTECWSCGEAQGTREPRSFMFVHDADHAREQTARVMFRRSWDDCEEWQQKAVARALREETKR